MVSVFPSQPGLWSSGCNYTLFCSWCFYLSCLIEAKILMLIAALDGLLSLNLFIQAFLIIRRLQWCRGWFRVVCSGNIVFPWVCLFTPCTLTVTGLQQHWEDTNMCSWSVLRRILKSSGQRMNTTNSRGWNLQSCCKTCDLYCSTHITFSLYAVYNYILQCFLKLRTPCPAAYIPLMLYILLTYIREIFCKLVHCFLLSLLVLHQNSTSR